MSINRFRVMPICLLGVLVGACNQTPSPQATGPTAAQVSDFARKASITLPASARATGWREERGIDDALWLRLTIAPAEVENFLDLSPFHGVELETKNKYLVGEFREWLVSPPARYRAGQLTLPNAKVLNLVIDEADPKVVTLYLMWHGT